MWKKHVVSVVAILALVVLAFGSAPTSEEGGPGRLAPGGAGTPDAAASVPLSNITWQQVDAIYNLQSKHTDLQKKEEWKAFEGKRVRWSGTVSSLGETFGTIHLQIKMNADTFTSDLLIRLKADQKSKALALKEGDSVTFEGTLNDWGTLLPITLKDGEIAD